MDVTAQLAIQVLSVGVDDANRQLDRLNRSAARTEHQTERVATATERMATTYRRLGSVLAVLGVAKLITEFVQAADAMKRMEGQLRLVTDGTYGLARAQEDLFNLAQETRTAYESTVSLYTRLARSTESLSLTHERLLAISETVNKAIQVGGITAQEASSGVIQFGQALASGTLRGDELRSVLENMPRLAQALKAGLEEQGLAGAAETATGALRRLASEGVLNTQTLVRALESQASALDSEFGKLPRTVGSAMTQLQNDVMRMIDGIDGPGGLSDSIIRLIDAFRDLANDTGFQAFLRGVIDLFATLVDTMREVISTFAEMTTFANRVAEEMAARATGASTTTKTVGGYLTGGGVQSIYEPPGAPVGGDLLSSRGGGGGGRADEFERLTQSIRDQLFLSATLEQQLSATSDAQRRRYEIALRMQEAEIDLLRDKRSLTEAERTLLRSLIEAEIEAESRISALRETQQQKEDALQDARRNSLEALEYEMRRSQAIGQEVATTFQDLFRSIATGSLTAADALGRVADMLLRVVEIAVFGNQGFGGFLGNLIGGGLGLLGGGPGAALQPGTTLPAVYAKGGVFDYGREIHPFARGGIVDRPTLFPFSSGGAFRMGVMGEAGEEAIMPLAQMRDGALGVRAAGGGGGTVVNNNLVVNVESNGQEPPEEQGRRIGRAIRTELDALVDQRMTKQLMPGGILYEAGGGRR